MMENLHGWYGKLLSPILVYYLGLPMLESFIPILAYHLCLTTIGWHNTNIGIPFLFHQHWILLYQYWLTIFVWPTLDDSIPILAYHFCLTNIGFFYTNIGLPFMFDQHWMTHYQYWHIIFVWPMLGYITLYQYWYVIHLFQR